jgi:hypothetical protein
MLSKNKSFIMIAVLITAVLSASGCIAQNNVSPTVTATPIASVVVTQAPTGSVTITPTPVPTSAVPSGPIHHVFGQYDGGSGYTVMLTALGGYRTATQTGANGDFELNATTSLTAYSLSVYDNHGNLAYNDQETRTFSANGYDNIGLIPGGNV